MGAAVPVPGRAGRDLPCPSFSQPGFAAPAAFPPGNPHGAAASPSFGQEFFWRDCGK